MPPEPRRLFIFRIFATRCGRRARAAAGRAAAGRERAALPRPLRGGAECLRVLRDGPPAHEREPPRDASSSAIPPRSWSVRASWTTSRTPLPAECRPSKRFTGCSPARRSPGLELEMRRRDGSPLWVSLWMRPMRGDDGTIQAVAFDLDRRHRPRAGRGRARRLHASRTSTSRKRSSPSTTSRRSSAAAPRWPPCSTRSAASPPPTPPS